jgi:RHS repeat-associated protein
MGNLLSAPWGYAAYSFAYSGTTPKLTSVTEAGTPKTVTYDAAGNETVVGTSTYSYSARNFPKTSGTIEYGYDAQGVRTTETSGSSKAYFFYSPDLHLLATTGISTLASPPTQTEYIWMNGAPVAQQTVSGSSVWTFTDHLGALLIQTNSAGAITWRAEYEPYGRIAVLRTGGPLDQILRYPGQEMDSFSYGPLGNSDRFYNIFRWYRSRWGRYTQADLLDSFGMENEYGYAMENPVTNFDSLGLKAEICCKPLANFAFGVWPLRGRHCFIWDDGFIYEIQREGGFLFFAGSGHKRMSAGSPSGICKECKPKCGGGNQRDCLDRVHNDYLQDAPYPFFFAPFGPNSNTYANTLAEECCQGGFPDDMGWTPGRNSPRPDPNWRP